MPIIHLIFAPQLYMGGDCGHCHMYGLINVAAFLAQAMKETSEFSIVQSTHLAQSDGKSCHGRKYGTTLVTRTAGTEWGQRKVSLLFSFSNG